MFEQLIETTADASAARRRRYYFLLSSVVVGILFIAALVISIYAAEIGLDADGWESSRLVLPAPEIDHQPDVEADSIDRRQVREPRRAVELPMAVPPKMIDIVDPTAIPPPISTAPGPAIEITGAGQPLAAAPLAGGGSLNTGGEPTGAALAEPVPDPPKPRLPDPPARTDPPRLDPPRLTPSLGVVNGIAVSLPKPVYPPAATTANVQGKVDVQVTIDEAGKVISSKAVSGPILLRHAAERAAWNARFTPTYLSKIPIKVSGVIVYNFTRN